MGTRPGYSHLAQGLHGRTSQCPGAARSRTWARRTDAQRFCHGGTALSTGDRVPGPSPSPRRPQRHAAGSPAGPRTPARRACGGASRAAHGDSILHRIGGDAREAGIEQESAPTRVYGHGWRRNRNTGRGGPPDSGSRRTGVTRARGAGEDHGRSRGAGRRPCCSRRTNANPDPGGRSTPRAAARSVEPPGTGSSRPWGAACAVPW